MRLLIRSGPHRLSNLLGPEGITQQAMTQLVRRLEKDGLAARGGDPADRRVVVVLITDAGRAAVARRREGRARALSAVLRQLPAEDRAALVAALPALERLVGLIVDDA